MKTSKSVSLIIFFSFLLISQLSAQTKIGLKTGLNFSTLTETGNYNNGWGINNSRENLFHLGLLLDIPMAKRLSLQPELVYNQKGMSLFDFNLPGAPGFKANLVLHYLDLNVLAKYRLGNEKMGFSIAAGPSLGYLMEGTIKVKMGRESVKVKTGADALGFDDLDLGAVLAAGFDYQVGPGSILFDLRYMHGLNSLFGLNYAPVNSTISASVGYMIKF